MRRHYLFILLFSLLIGCGADQGTLAFYANGEDFVRQGFTSKDGWTVQFDQLLVDLSNVTAYQTDPPFNAQSGESPQGTAVTLSQNSVVDLAAGGETADPILVGTATADTGHYNAIGWEMNGESVQLSGSAEKEGRIVTFNLRIDQSYRYVCGEYVGDERKGFVDPDETGTIEMTFHFDHLFGDGEIASDENLNVGALGFEPLAALAVDDALDATHAELEAQLSSADFETLNNTLATLGHVGEGHCYEATGGYTAK